MSPRLRGGPNGPSPTIRLSPGERKPPMRPRRLLFVRIALTVFALVPAVAAQDDPLPSWSDGPAKAAIVRFVGDVTRRGGPGFVPAEERVAVFDNDGTLWTEQPYYNQVAFAFDRIKALAPAHPDWKDKPPFRAVLEGDVGAVLAGTPRDRLEILAASHAGMTTDEFDRIVKDWMTTSRHPRFNRPYTELAYRPM